MSHALTKPQKIALLCKRAEMLATARRFFADRKIIEVDCGALCEAPSLDLHIDPMETDWGNGKTSYLHTSPEYHMKRLLSLGMGDIYQLGHVFRKEEKGDLHHPEFTMAEWYRTGVTFEAFIQETLDFIKLFLGKDLPVIEKSYRDLFLEHLHIDPFVDKESIIQRLPSFALPLPDGIEEWDKDILLAYLLTHFIEQYMGKDSLFILKEFPASQAALARIITKEGLEVAKRFEVYYQSIELANGYHELADSYEQRNRFIETNKQRKDLGKKELPLDEEFLSALEKGIGECCGVAVGFDRLLMLQSKQPTIHHILP